MIDDVVAQECRAMETVENITAVFHRSHSPYYY